MKRLGITMLAASMIWAACGPAFAEGSGRATPALYEGEDDIPVIYDVLIMRPLGLAACIVGLAAAVVALPFAIPSGSTDKVYQALIVDPFHYTFKRPLGKNRASP